MGLIEGLPDTSKYRTVAERDGEFTEPEQALIHLLNETARMHHTLQVVNADPEKWEDYEPPRFLLRGEREEFWRERRADQEGLAEAVDETEDDMYGYG